MFEGFGKLKTAGILYNRAIGETPCYCIKCKKIETTKLLEDNASHSYKCDCGITIYRYHEPDAFHKEAFFVKSFIPVQDYRRGFVLEKQFEKNGFKKEGDRFVK